jgi:hypothetical protein
MSSTEFIPQKNHCSVGENSMKKLLTLACALTLIAGSALAASPERLFIQPNATFPTGAPATTNNDDSCDVGNAPAATLLLPFFSVDVTNATGVNTLFTLTNTSQFPQIAHVTVWTDWSYPVLDFNIFLTGYDVQGVSLRDIIAPALPDIPPTGTTTTISPRGTFSALNTANPNFNPAEIAACASLPGNIPDTLQAEVLSALTTGEYQDCDELVGGSNPTAQGYVTVDVVDSCSQLLPTDPTFYEADILWDNTLIGDYQVIDIGGRFAGGESMVSVRAIPEGGNRLAGPVLGVDTNFPYTFYDRYTGAVTGGNREIDRRMPLPGVWAARFISGGALDFDAELQVWREGNTTAATTVGGTAECDITPWELNGQLDVVALVRFDERENPSVSEEICQISPCPGIVGFVTEEASRNNVADTDFFPPPGTAAADGSGWMYMNLNNGCEGGTDPCSDRAPLGFSSQSWVTVHMAAEGSSFAVDFDAAWLQNGCSANPGGIDPTIESSPTTGPTTGQGGVIGPGANATPAVP